MVKSANGLHTRI